MLFLCLIYLDVMYLVGRGLMNVVPGLSARSVLRTCDNLFLFQLLVEAVCEDTEGCYRNRKVFTLP